MMLETAIIRLWHEEWYEKLLNSERERAGPQPN